MFDYLSRSLGAYNATAAGLAVWLSEEDLGLCLGNFPDLCLIYG